VLAIGGVVVAYHWFGGCPCANFHQARILFLRSMATHQKTRTATGVFVIRIGRRIGKGTR
jgi:hypothetical protein